MAQNNTLLAVDQRKLMTVAATVAAGAAVAPAGAVIKHLDLGNEADARTAIRKLRYRTDEGLLFWWIKGQCIADVDTVLTPLYGMEFGSIQHITQRADGGFDVRQIEPGFRTYLETGKLLSKYGNPLTNEVVDCPFSPIGPSLTHYSPDAIPTVPKELGGSQIEFNPEKEKPYQLRDQVLLPFRAHLTVRTPGFSNRIINDISMIYGPASQVFDPKISSVDACVHSSDITTYPRWSNMGDRPGIFTLRGVGAKQMRISEMPKE